MFTGLIETTGVIRALQSRGGGMLLSVEPGQDGFIVSPGASVSVNGACLTLERMEGRACVFSAVQETLRRTTLADCRAGAVVNLERALRLSDRLDGHMVLGHVDAVGRIVAARHEGESVVFTIEVPEPLMVYMAEKGSVAVDGISLTIAASAPGRIEVALIPHTLGKTTMAVKRVGDRVNIECDVLARYLVHLLRSDPSRPEQARGDSLLDRLARAGF